MNEVDIQYMIAHWKDTFCLYDPTDDEEPYKCIGADQHGVLYIYTINHDDMEWKGYVPKDNDRFFIVTEEVQGLPCQLH